MSIFSPYQVPLFWRLRHLSTDYGGIEGVERLVLADQSLLFGLVVGVPDEDREQFERVTVRSRSAAGAFVDSIQFIPENPSMRQVRETVAAAKKISTTIGFRGT